MINLSMVDWKPIIPPLAYFDEGIGPQFLGPLEPLDPHLKIIPCHNWDFIGNPQARPSFFNSREFWNF